MYKFKIDKLKRDMDTFKKQVRGYWQVDVKIPVKIRTHNNYIKDLKKLGNSYRDIKIKANKYFKLLKLVKENENNKESIIYNSYITNLENINHNLNDQLEHYKKVSKKKRQQLWKAQKN